MPLRGSPAVDLEGRIFICVDDRLLMFLPDNETPEWDYVLGGPAPRSAVIGPDGNVRVHSSDGFLHVVDPGGEKVIEPVSVGDPLGWASPLVDRKNNTYVSRSDGGLIKVPLSGELARRPFLRTRRRFDCSGVICGEMLYIGCEDHYVYAIPLDADRGANIWAASPSCGRTHCAINAPLAVAQGPELLVASQDDHLYGFGIDGEEHWSITLPGKLLGSPVADEKGTIFVGMSLNLRDRDSRGILAAIEPNARRIRWKYDADAPIESTPVIGDDGVIYVGDNAGTIHAVDADGRPVWRAEFNSPVRSAGVIVQPERLAFGLDDGTLVLLECSSKGVRSGGWPKVSGTLGQSGQTSGD